MQQYVGKSADNTGAIVPSSEDHTDDSQKLVADFLAGGGRIKRRKPQTFNQWAQQHRRVRGARSLKGRRK